MTSATGPTISRKHDILIVDDERLARAELRRMLVQLGHDGKICEAESVKAALAALQESPADLLMLDIQMPGASGFELLRELGPKHPPVIFTTAYEQFAIQAFDVDALDYLLKPFDEARLSRALARAERPVKEVEKLGDSDSILLKIGKECLLLPVASIERIEAADRGSLVFWADQSGRINRTIGSLEEQLDPNIFFRSSRDCLLNTRMISSISQDDSGQFVATLPHNRSVTFSRRQGVLFRKQYGI
jgi:two-component system LytT family response regulator